MPCRKVRWRSASGPADDEDDRVKESRDEGLKREALSLEHMILHDRKNPFCEHCCRGRMLRRYALRFRADPEEGDVPYERAKAFGDIIEADNIFSISRVQRNGR